MKKLRLILLFELTFSVGFCQYVVNNVRYDDIDDYDQRDSLVAKHKMHLVDCYYFKGMQFIKDSAVLYCSRKYDPSGRLVELVRGRNVGLRQMGYMVKYRKLSDTLYETVCTYPPGSTMIPDDLFVDSVENGAHRRICLYKKDIEQNVYERSQYDVDKQGTLIKIRRYDIDGVLRQVFYPLGQRNPEKEWTDSTLGVFDNAINYHAIFKDSYYKERHVVSKHGHLAEWSYSSKLLSDTSNDFTKRSFVYDQQNRPLITITVDEENHFISEERFSYKNGKLLRYTKSFDLSDSLFNEDQQYDSAGKLLFSQTHHSGSNSVRVSRYQYDPRGFLDREEVYINGKFDYGFAYFYQ